MLNSLPFLIIFFFFLQTIMLDNTSTLLFDLKDQSCSLKSFD